MFRSLQEAVVTAASCDIGFDKYLMYVGPAFMLIILIAGLLDRPRDNDTMSFSRKVTTLSTACGGFFLYYIVSEQIVHQEAPVTNETDWKEVFVDITENNGLVSELKPTDKSGAIVSAMYFVTEYVFVFDGFVGALGLADRFLQIPINDVAWQVTALTIGAVHLPGVLLGNLTYLSLVVIALVTSDIFGVGVFDTVGSAIDKAVAGVEGLLFAGLTALGVGDFTAKLIGSTSGHGAHAAIGALLGTAGSALQVVDKGSPISAIINTRTITALFSWFGSIAHCQTDSNQIVNYATIAVSLVHTLSVSTNLCSDGCATKCDDQFSTAITHIESTDYFKWIQMAGTVFTAATGGILFHHSVNKQASCVDSDGGDNDDTGDVKLTYLW